MKMKVKTQSQSNVNSDTKAKKAVLSTEDLENIESGDSTTKLYCYGPFGVMVMELMVRLYSPLT
jgi:hypothetical protein